MRAKIQLFFQIARIILWILTLFAHNNCSFFHGSRYIMYGNSPRKQLNSIKMMNRKVLFWPLAAVLLTACEKGLVDGVADVAPAGQAANSVLQVRTRSGGSAGEEATVAYPIAVYVFSGEECRAVQTIGDEGQTLNIPLVEGTYTVYAIGGASSSDYVLPTADDALATSAIVLKDGKTHGDLMAAQATATLTDGGTNTVTLGLTGKTMLIQSVVVKEIPGSGLVIIL